MSTAQSTSGWSKEKIINQIKALDENGADLSYNNMSRERQGLLAAANYHFGSWGEAVTAAGINYDRDVRRIPKWTPDRIIESIQEAAEAGADLSWTSVTNDERYSALAYAAIRENQFGSWDAALEAAGEDPADVRRYESWSEEKIIRRIQQRRKKDQPLNSKAMQEQDSKLFNAALNYFGGWDKALEAAGIDPSKVYKRRRWNKDVIKKEIKALDEQGEDLAAPNMRRNHSPLYSAACKYFGTWTAAREACGIQRNFHKRNREQ
jgi:enamine deaminase RidA (YjgF/YER057c/UK114 family)